MSLSLLRILLVVACLCLGAPGRAQSPSAPVTVELFTTSKGCGNTATFQPGEAIQFRVRLSQTATASLVLERPDLGTLRTLFTTTLESGRTYSIDDVAGPPGPWRLLLITIKGEKLEVTATCEYRVERAEPLVEMGDGFVPRTELFGQLGNPQPVGVTTGSADVVLSQPPQFPGTFLLPDASPRPRTICGTTLDGSLFVTDTAGTALLQLRGEERKIRLDTAAQDPEDQVGFARLLRVETSRTGTSAVLALRADNIRGLYRLANDRLTRLALLPDTIPLGEEEFAIDDLGQITYVSSSPSTGLTVFQAGAAAIVGASLPLEPLPGGAKVTRISSLQATGAGDLVFLLTLDRNESQIVVRKTATGLEPLARTGDLVAPAPGAAVRRRLNALRRPRLGADGTVVFLGVGGLEAPFDSLFVNFFGVQDGRSPVPLLSETIRDADLFDDAVAPDGTIAVWESRGGSPRLFLVTPSGRVSPVDLGRLSLQGRLIMGPAGQLFFLAGDPSGPLDREGEPPVGLYRVRFWEGRPVGQPEAVAVVGQAVPGKPGLQLQRLAQPPVPAATGMVLMVQFGPQKPSAEPTTGFFRVPWDGSFAESAPLAEEGAALPGTNRLALLRELSYQGEELVFGGLQPGAGPVIATLTSHGSTAGKVRTQAAKVTADPLLAMGDDLGSGRKLKAILGPILPLGRDGQLLVARFSQEGGLDGQGLFTLRQDPITRVSRTQAVAVTQSTAPAPVSVPIAAVADPPASGTATAIETVVDCSTYYTDTHPESLGLPSIWADPTNVSLVFKARLERLGGDPFGAFQWTSAGNSLTWIEYATVVAMPDDTLPYELLRCRMGPSRAAYLLVRTANGRTRLFRDQEPPVGRGLEPLVVPERTPVLGGGPALVAITDFVITGDGSVFVAGRTGSDAAGVFQVTKDGLLPVALTGQRLPRFDDGSGPPNGAFDDRFGLMPGSARGVLLFRARVKEPDGTSLGRRGLFQFDPQQGLQTLVVEKVALVSARDLVVDTLGNSLDQQASNGTTTVSAVRDKKGHWLIVRWQRLPNSPSGKPQVERKVIAAEGAQFPTLDPSQLLSLPCRSGPLFALSDAGDVAFLASNGKRWGIYLFPASQ